jgi:hypothetical protein
MNEQQLAAVKQALEVLKECSGLAPFEPPPKAVNAITALQSIISQDALYKKWENAHELGLDYEPAVQEPVTCKHEWFRTGAMEPGECRCINCGMWNTTTSPAAQPVPVKTYSGGKPWPVAPKPWVGLTDDEIDAVHSSVKVRLMGTFDTKDIYRAVEAKLKEKNT